MRPYPNVDSGRWQISTEGGSRPAWSRSGTELFFVDGNDLLTSAEVHATDRSFTAGRPTKILNVRYVTGATGRGFDLRGYDVTADGQRFLVLKDEASTAAPPPQPTMTVVLNWSEELKSRLSAR